MKYRIQIRGDRATMAGIVNGTGTVVARNDRALVVKFPGYRYNAGNPHLWRQLTSYVPASTRVFAIEGETESGSLICSDMIEWQNRK